MVTDDSGVGGWAFYKIILGEKFSINHFDIIHTLNDVFVLLFSPLVAVRFKIPSGMSTGCLLFLVAVVRISNEKRAMCRNGFCVSFVVPPRNLMIDIQKDTAVEGEEIEVNCTAMASKPATTIRWFKGNKELKGEGQAALSRSIGRAPDSSRATPWGR